MNLIPLDDCETSQILIPGPFYCNWTYHDKDDNLTVHLPTLTPKLVKEMAYSSSQEFKQSQGFINWKRAIPKQLFPMLDDAWPVCLPPGLVPEDAVALMQIYGLGNSLVTLERAPEGLPEGRHSYITLTDSFSGDAWDLAGAYLCCGSVPTMVLMKSLTVPEPTAMLAPKLFVQVFNAFKGIQQHLPDEVNEPFGLKPCSPNRATSRRDYGLTMTIA